MEESFRDIIDTIKMDAPAVVPPLDFTQRVMDRLPELKPGILFRVKQALLQPREVDFNLARVIAGSAKNPAECAFSFFVTGFFYLIMGVVLIIGLKGFMSEMTITQWVKMQPLIIVVTALWLIIQSIALFLDGKVAVKAAELGTLFFIGFAIMNGLMMKMALHTPLSVVCAVAFAGTGVMMGIFLGFTIRSFGKYQRNVREQKGFSG
jgi:hypothetical protein